MREREEQRLADLKVDRVITRGMYGLWIAMTAGSTIGAGASLPIAILDILPQWIEITIPAVSILFIPGCYHDFHVYRGWKKEAEQAVLDFETQNQVKKLEF